MTNHKELKPCPCGKTPTALSVHDNGQGMKWAQINPECCCVWGMEFRTQYETGNKLMALAVETWNAAPRSDEIGSLKARVEKAEDDYKQLLKRDTENLKKLIKAEGVIEKIKKLPRFSPRDSDRGGVKMVKCDDGVFVQHFSINSIIEGKEDG